MLSRTSNAVTPVDLATGTAGPAIRVGPQPSAIAVTPDGRTAYVVDANDQAGNADGMVTPITTATDEPGRPIQVGPGPDAIAITPDGRTAYVANQDSDTVTPITIATNTPGKPIKVGEMPGAIAITPDGQTAYVASYLPAGGTGLSGSVTPIATATNTPGNPISVGADPKAIAITPDGQTAYVASGGDDTQDASGIHQAGTVTPITVATNQPGKPIKIGGNPALITIAITPDGQTAYVLGEPPGKGSDPAPSGDGFVVPIATATDRPGKPIRVGAVPSGLAITPDGKTLYVPDSGSDDVTPIGTAANSAGPPISTPGAGPVAVLIGPDGQTAYAVGISGQEFSGSLTPIAIATGKPGSPVAVGPWPSASAILTGGHIPYAETVAATSVLPLFASISVSTVAPALCPQQQDASSPSCPSPVVP